MHLEYLRSPKNQELEISFSLLKILYDEKVVQKNLSGIIKHKKKSKNDEIENLSPASKKDIQLITLSGEPISKFKLLKRTFIVALTDLLANLSISSS